MDYDQNNDRLVGYRVLNNDQNNDRLAGVLQSKNKMLSLYNVHKFTISITIIRSQSVHSTHIHDIYYYDNVILPFGIYIITALASATVI